MDVLPSSEFRKRYASLTNHTEVTVNGHVIGRWSPVNAPVEKLSVPRLFPPEPEDIEDAPRLAAFGRQMFDEVERFNTRPFTPVPKRGK